MNALRAYLQLALFGSLFTASSLVVLAIRDGASAKLVVAIVAAIITAVAAFAASLLHGKQVRS